MALDLECPGCNAELRGADALIEKIVRCPKCRALTYLSSDEKPLPEICDMELGPEPFVVQPRHVVAEISPGAVVVKLPLLEDVLPGSETGGIGSPQKEGAP